MIKVMWCVAPESSIHKSFFDLRQPHESLSKSIDELQAMIPAKFAAPQVICSSELASPDFPN